MLHLPNHTLKLKAPDKPQSAVFWHVILDNYLCNALCKFFAKIESNWCFSKTYSEIESTWSIKSSKEEIVWPRDGKNYSNNVSWKFLIKIESTWRREVKEQTPRLTLLYHGRTVRSSHRRCCIRKLFLKICNIHLCWSLCLKALQTFRPATLLKSDPTTGVFLWIVHNS